MRMMFVLLAVLTVSACETPEKTISEMDYAERKALADQIVTKCAGQGLAPNSPEMTLCANAEVDYEHNRRERNRERAQDNARAIAAGMQSFGQGYKNAARPVSCTSSPSGYVISNNIPRSYTTTCY